MNFITPLGAPGTPGTPGTLGTLCTLGIMNTYELVEYEIQ